MEEGLGCSSSAIDSSNIGFRLLKKQGWKEGTGLGIAEQGRLEPLQPHVKNNKRGLGADKTKKKCVKLLVDSGTKEHNNSESQDHMASGKKSKALSKRMRKLQEEEKRMQEKEFDRAFFREFWPDNV